MAHMDTTLSAPNVRIARTIRTEQGGIIKIEVGGSWFVQPEEVKASAKWDYIVRTLADFQSEEPKAGWNLQTQGTEATWHAWKP